MLETSDPIRLVGRTVDLCTVSGTRLSGTLCSAGMGGVIIHVDSARHAFSAEEITRLEARGWTGSEVGARCDHPQTRRADIRSPSP